MIKFTDGSSFASNWIWSFPGGKPNTLIQSPAVAYNTAGTYDVTLIVGGLGGSDTLTKTNHVTVTAYPGQGTWIQRASLVGPPRAEAVTFSIGDKGYFGTGREFNGLIDIYYKDFWEWDQATNTWTQKADFGGTSRNYATGFSIGNKGYICFGSYTENDFWEWDQNTNVWTKKAGLPGTARANTIGFSIGTKGYIGTGGGFNGVFYNDFWEWDQTNNVWTQKANYGGMAIVGAVGFAIGSKGYIGGGATATGMITNDFWEWDQAANVWTQKTDLGLGPRYLPVGFSIGTKGYIGTGWDSSGLNRKDFWEWDQATDQWTRLANYSGASRAAAVGMSVGNKGYIGSGLDDNFSYKNDFWEYTPNATGIFEKENNFSVNVYPNPALNKITIDLKGLDTHNSEIKLINALGQIMVSKNIVYAEDQIELNTDNLENGIYFIFVQTNNQRLSQKIIIQK